MDKDLEIKYLRERVHELTDLVLKKEREKQGIINQLSEMRYECENLRGQKYSWDMTKDLAIEIINKLREEK